jgi:hypothetical protein
MVSITKSPGKLSNHLTVKCPCYDQTYDLGYSDDEWHRVKDWLDVAARALREDHNRRRHESEAIELNCGGAWTLEIGKITGRSWLTLPFGMMPRESGVAVISTSIR